MTALLPLAALAQHRQPSSDFEGLLQLGFLILFIALPVLKSILDSRKRRGPTARERRPAPTTDPRRGKSLWEMLEQGLEVEPPEPVRPEPPPAAEVAAPPVEEVAEATVPWSAPDLPAPAAPPRPASAPVPIPVPAPRTALPVEPAAEGVGAFEPASFAPSTQRATFEPTTVRSSFVPAIRTDAARGRAARRRAALGLPSPRRAGAWRRALVLHEVLGPPVALRRPAGDLGPAGLRP